LRRAFVLSAVRGRSRVDGGDIVDIGDVAEAPQIVQRPGELLSCHYFAMQLSCYSGMVGAAGRREKNRIAAWR